MKTRKASRFLALFLSLVMLAGLLPTLALADGYVDISPVGDTYLYPEIGDTVTLEVELEEGSLTDVTYEWYESFYNDATGYWDDYARIEGAASSSYTVADLYQSRYYCKAVATDAASNYDTVYFYVYPQNSFDLDRTDGYGDLYVALNSTVELEVEATGDDLSRVTYQWYVRVLDENGYGDWEPIQGANSATYTAGPVTYFTEYYCKAWDGYGSYDTVYIDVYVDTGFSLSRSGDYNQTAGPNQPLTLSVNVTANDMSKVSYRWEYGGDDVGTAATYAIDSLNAENTGYYYCYVSDGYGRQSYTYYYVKVDNGLTAVALNKETEISAAPGASVTLTVVTSATDMEGVTYSWSKDYSTIQGATGNTYTIDSLSADTKGSYRCYVSDAYGNSNTVYFSVSIDTGFSLSRVGGYNQSAGPGQPLTLSVSVTANDMSLVSYRWTKSYYGDTLSTTSSYTIESMDADACGTYYCYVSDGYGTETSVYYYVQVDNGFSATRVGDYTRYVAPGQSTTLEVNVTATDKTGMTATWYFDGEEVGTGESYTIDAVSAETVGEYYFYVSDAYGNSQSVYFYVNVDNGFSIERVGEYNQGAAPGESLTLSVAVEATDTSKLSYRWCRGYYDDTLSTDATYTIQNMNVDACGTYYCYVDDGYGNTDYTYYEVFVDNGFSVESASGDTSVAVLPHGNVTLEVAVTAVDSEGITYQWYGPNGRINGATTASYALQNVVTAANYRCAVADAYGNGDTIYFYVTVDNNFSVDRVGTYSNGVAPGASVTLAVSVTANDDSNLSYSWTKGSYGEEVSTEATFTIESMDADARGYYYCYVDDGYGNSDYTSFKVYVENNLSLNYVSASEIGVTPGASATMEVSVSAADTSQLAIRWSGPDGTVTDASGKPYEQTSLSLSNVRGYQAYSCTVTDQYGNSDELDFTVYVENHLLVRRVGLQSVGVEPHSTVTLEVTVSADDDSELLIEWSSNSEEFEETGTALTIEDVTGRGYYTCTVSDQYGNSRSISFSVYVENHLSISPVGAYSFGLEPFGSATLEVAATADDDSQLTYRWSGTDITDAGNTTSITVTDVDSVRWIYCYVEDQYDNQAYTSFYVYVENHLSAVSATGQTAYVVEPGDDLTLAVIATADDDTGLTYSWSGSTSVGGKTDTLTLTDIQKSGYYTCQVYDRYGNNDYVYFNVVIENHLRITQTPGHTIWVQPGDDLTMTVIATADDLEGVTYEWEDWNYGILSEPSNSYTAENIEKYNKFSCTVKDRFGNSETAWFEVYIQNHLTLEPVGATSITVQPGQSATMTVAVSADNDVGLHVQWYEYLYDRVNGVYSDYEPLDGASGTTLTIDNVRAYRRFFVEAIDCFGNEARVDFSVGVENGFTVTRVGDPVRSVAYGGSVTLAVNATATDTTDMHYNWSLTTYDPISGSYSKRTYVGGDTASYTLTDITVASRVRCTVTDRYGNTKSIQYTVGPENNLTVSAVGNAMIVAPEGEQVTMRVSASADDTDNLCYTWGFVSGQYADGVSVETIKGANDDFLTVSAEDGAQYVCTVYDCYGNTGSVWFEIVAEAPPIVITGSPADAVVEVNTTATFTVTAVSENPLSYQWYVQKSADGVWSLISGATSATYSLTAKERHNGYKYKAIVSDGSYTTESGVAMLKVYTYTAPVIVTEPEDLVVVVGATATFTVAAEGGSGELSYQWKYRTSEEGAWTNVSAASGKTASYSLTVKDRHDGYQYCCEITDGKSTVESNVVTLTVGAPITITEQPADYLGPIGSTATFTVDAEGGIGSLSYQWKYRTSEAGAWTDVSAASGKTASYSLTVKDRHDGYQYCCEITDGKSTVESNVVTLTVGAPITITRQPEDMECRAGSTALFTVEAEGENVAYQWYERRTDGSEHVLDETTNSLVVTATEEMHGYQYYCVCSNELTQVESDFATLYVEPILAPEILLQPEDYTGPVGSVASFSVMAEGTNELSYQWKYRTSEESAWTNVSAASGKTANYSMTVKERHNGYQYKCVVTDGNATAESDVVTLTVTSPVTIIRQPMDYTGAAGSTATFAVGATGTGSLSYQWKYRTSEKGAWTDVSAASGKTAAYSLTVKERHNGYQYKCVVTCGNATAESNIATLTVEAPSLAIIRQPADYVGPAGETATFTVGAEGGSGALSYQWKYRTSEKGAWTDVSAASGKTASYSLTVKDRHDGYQYKCVVTDGSATVESNIVTLTIGEPLEIADEPADQDVEEGEEAVFSVFVETDRPVTYQWYVLKSPSGDWTAVKSGGKAADYWLTAQLRHNGYKYKCLVSDGATQLWSAVVTLTVTPSAAPGAQVLITQQPADFTGAAGSTATFTVAATGGSGALSYQWKYRTSETGEWTDVSASSGRTASYSLTVKARHDGYQYKCVVTDGKTTAESDIVSLTIG